MRRLTDIFFAGFCAFCAAAAVAVILGIIAALCWKGVPAMSAKFLTFDTDQGIGYHFAGTMILITTALFVATPLATALP